MASRQERRISIFLYFSILLHKFSLLKLINWFFTSFYMPFNSYKPSHLGKRNENNFIPYWLNKHFTSKFQENYQIWQEINLNKDGRQNGQNMSIMAKMSILSWMYKWIIIIIPSPHKKKWTAIDKRVFPTNTFC